MGKFFLALTATLVYLETVYHVCVAGGQVVNPLLGIPVVLTLSGIEFFFLSIGKKTVNRVALWSVQGFNFLLFASQLIYIRIFTQPLLLAAAVNAGEAALKNYWRELLYAIGQNIVPLLFLALPLGVTGLLLHRNRKLYRERKEEIVKKEHGTCRILSGISVAAGLVMTCIILLIGRQGGFLFYEDYQSYYDPKYVVETFGVLASVQRDLLGDVLPDPVQEDSLSAMTESEQTDGKSDSVLETETHPSGESGTATEGAGTTPQGTETSEGAGTEGQTETEEVIPEEPEILPQVLDVDFVELRELLADSKGADLVSYMENRTPTYTNEYTGLFEGYNLIYLTAEGFSPYAISEELTPTLWRLANTGFVAKNYYVPLWQTSTSDGEYVNLTGQIPYQQFSMKKSAENEQPYSLPAYFAAEGVKSFAYHNNSLDYYDRHISHPNLGYDFKASKLGDLSEAEWGGQIFAMENPNSWPASDLDMIKATLPEYIGEERFHAYYMTVSGHMNYNFTGNRMSAKHKEEVAGLSYSEEGRAYIACNMELDRALAYLIEELDKAGKLDNTVIALSSDHYPYGMKPEHYEELAGMELDQSLDLYRNTLILWNSQMAEPVIIEKPCSAIDLLPTLYNLFGFSYDSRLFAGKDMLSDSRGLVVFSDRSFITEELSYHKATGKVVSRTGAEPEPEYVEQAKQQVKELYQYSNGILRYNFFHYVEQARNQEDV